MIFIVSSPIHDYSSSGIYWWRRKLNNECVCLLRKIELIDDCVHFGLIISVSHACIGLHRFFLVFTIIAKNHIDCNRYNTKKSFLLRYQISFLSMLDFILSTGSNNSIKTKSYELIVHIDYTRSMNVTRNSWTTTLNNYHSILAKTLIFFSLFLSFHFDFLLYVYVSFDFISTGGSLNRRKACEHWKWMYTPLNYCVNHIIIVADFFLLILRI